ncbi:MAG: 1,6-anhydro-N-acetylmuramyl-L-alanine amidase AmpD [Vibrionaceae bacterium]
MTKHQIDFARRSPCTHYDERPDQDDISLLVIHNISLPPGEFGGCFIEDFFQGKLDGDAHPYFLQIKDLRVSAHCLIKRDGEVVQFVPFDKRAWHAGVSQFQGRERCNDFSIGIELEGTDHLPYTQAQYQALCHVTHYLLRTYPKLSLDHIVGHSDIAPLRKTDPGKAFDWDKFKAMLASEN